MIRVLSSAFALAAVLSFSSGATSADTIKIGYVGPLSGPAAALGIQTRQGIDLAIEELNTAGGVQVAGKKYTLEPIFEDSASRPEVGVSAAQKLLTRDKVNFLVADTIASSVTLAVMDLAPAFDVPMMSAQPVSSAISKKILDNREKYKNFWKGDWNSEEYGRIVYDFATWMIESKHLTPNSKSVAFVVEDTDYGRSNAQVAIEFFKKGGWKTGIYEVVPLGYTDFYPQLAKLRANEPDLVVSAFTAGNSGVAFVRQVKESGLESLMFGLAFPGYAEFLPQARNAADGLTWAAANFDRVNDPKQKAFNDRFKAKHKNDSSHESVWGYCFTKLIADVYGRSADLTTANVVKAIGASDFTCEEYGRWVFNAENQTAKAGPEFLPLRVGQIWNGESKVIFPEQFAAAKYRRK